MSDTNIDIDDPRYRHHLKHRGSANRMIFWIVWSCIAVFLLIRLLRQGSAWWSRRLSHSYHFISLAPARASLVKRAFAFIDAIFLLRFPQVLRHNQSTTSSGRIIPLTAYLAIIISLLLSVDAPTSTSHFADDVAFRSAWVTVVQIPLVFFLSTKRGPLNSFANISYDKINWLHKWVGRMIFISATTHAVIMKSSITIADILLSKDKGTTVVRYGIGSYLSLTWIAVSSIIPLRTWSYRAFYINHWISTLGFLMMVLHHVPKHATTPIYLAFGFVAIDKIWVFATFLVINISVRSFNPKFARFRRAPGRAMLVAGYPVEMLEPHNLSVSTDVEESATMIRICNVPLSWRPGQHIRLYLPALGGFEVHPFTPANCSSVALPPQLPPRRNNDVETMASIASCSVKRSSDVLLMVCAHSGLTRRLKEYHTEWLTLPCPNTTISSPATSLTAYIDGPYGDPPHWEVYEDLVLIATSTGISFMLSIMDYLAQLSFSDSSKASTRTIRFVWVLRHIDPQLEASVSELLRRNSTMMQESGIRIDIRLHVTCPHADIDSDMPNIDQFAHLRRRIARPGSSDRLLTIRNPDEIYEQWEEEERQWREMVMLEEMRMKDPDRVVDAYEANSVYSYADDKAAFYEDEIDASSESSTLLDRPDEAHDESKNDASSVLCLTPDRIPAHNTAQRLPSPIHSPHLRHDALPKKQTCQCALVQYQRRNLGRSAKSSFDSTTYGLRPDISRIISSSVDEHQHSKLMVAICANKSVSIQANKAVSRAKMAFARGQRAKDVEIFTEGFS